MELTTVSRPYAKAAFAYADVQNSLDNWSAALSELARVIADDRVNALLTNPLATTTEHADALVSLMGDNLNAQQQNFVRNMANNKRLELMATVSELFDLMKANKQQIIDVTVSSAFNMSAAQQTALSKALTEHLEREVTLQVEVDQSLLAGVLIQAGDTQIDASLKGRLNKLTEALTH